MKVARTVVITVMAQVLLWQAIGQVLPTIGHEAPVYAAEATVAAGNQSDSPEVLIAVLDSGIDETHEDLAGKVVSRINLTDSPTASDRLGHGTHVAGIIAAKTADETIRLLNVKIADDKGLVWPSVLAEGIVWAVGNGAQIINTSLAIPTGSSALEDAVGYASSRGVIIIAAAGNNASSIAAYPASYANVVAVAATNEDGSVWSQSNDGEWVDVYAPGVDIYSTLPGNSYGYRSGTSMATSYVSAEAGLLFAVVDDINGDGEISDEVRAAIENGCDELGTIALTNDA